MSDRGEHQAERLAAEIAAAIEEVAQSLVPVPSAERVDDDFIWSREGRRFATRAGATAAFRIGPEIGAAALLTPDVAGSPLGQDWIAFSPPTLDGYARDRLVAWFAAAHRRAAGSRASRRTVG